MFNVLSLMYLLSSRVVEMVFVERVNYSTLTIVYNKTTKSLFLDHHQLIIVSN